MNKVQILDKLDQTWAELQGSFAGLSESQMTQPGVTGKWSLKDILAHVTTWESEALKYLPLIAEDGRPPRYRDQYGGINAFNALMTEQKGTLPLAEVLQQLEETHEQLVLYLQQAPEELFSRETRFLRRLRTDSTSHYPEHTRAIQEWRAKNT